MTDKNLQGRTKHQESLSEALPSPLAQKPAANLFHCLRMLLNILSVLKGPKPVLVSLQQKTVFG